MRMMIHDAGKGTEGTVAMTREKPDYVQLKNPRTGRYVKIDRTQGLIVAHKKSEGPYKNVPIAPKTRLL
jgi:hypothetical protein